MRTLLPEEMKEQPLVKLAIGFTLIAMVGFVVTGFLLYFQHMDLSPSSVVSYFSGSEQEYRPARSVESMLGVTHAHTIALAAALLLLSLLLIRSSLSISTKKAFIVLPFVSAILNEAASWLVWSGVPGSAWLKILAFLALEISLGAMILLLVVAYFKPPRKMVEPGPPQRQPSSAPQQRSASRQSGAPQGGQRRRRRRPRRRGGPGRPGGGGPPQGPPPSA